MMNTVHISREMVPILKSGLNLRKKILFLKKSAFRRRLRSLEKKYRMTTSRFLKAFKAGNLQDAQPFIEWEYLAECYENISRELKKISHLKL